MLIRTAHHNSPLGDYRAKCWLLRDPRIFAVALIRFQGYRTLSVRIGTLGIVWTDIPRVRPFQFSLLRDAA